jgi:hypothetical protein
MACQTQAPQQEGARPSNALQGSSSPYLLQHAHNPVDWQPWGDEALAKAQEEDKLLIISIGYAACHWCHVMEAESFEDTTVARLMNANFVSIKVDREQRPDVDHLYMNAAMITSGRSGWPLNVIALPDGRPVFAATYFPKDRWMQLLEQFAELYQTQPAQLTKMAVQVTEGVQRMDYAALNDEAAAFTRPQLDSAVATLLAQMDLTHGGLQGAPKFPLPLVQELLLRYHQLSGDPRALKAVTTTLDHLRRGGIYDHLGGGIARYAVDSLWHVPHFEKMLYDNAQLVSLYSQAYQVTGDSSYRQVVQETLGFVARELTDSLGGFYSSLDADSEGEEGRFYTWTEKEVSKTLGYEADWFKDYYNLSPFGNWAERRADQLNILHITDPAAAVAKRYGLSDGEWQQRMTQAKAKLFDKRSQRERPALDDKVLTSWNALMLRAYADAYRALGEPSYLTAARKNAQFLQAHLTHPDGGLYRSWRAGKPEVRAFAIDYALLIDSYLAMYQATFEAQWLSQADALMQEALAQFFDEETGLFYLTSDQDSPLFSRGREIGDNVLPSANSVLARDLFYLGQYLYQPDYLAKAEQMLNNVVANVPQGGVSTANWSILLSHYVFPFYEVAIVGEDWDAKRAALDRQGTPNQLWLGPWGPGLTRQQIGGWPDHDLRM